MNRIYEFTYGFLPLEDRVLMWGWRTTSTSPSSSSEEVSSEEVPPEDPSSHEKSDRSEKSLSFKIFEKLSTPYLNEQATWARRPAGSPWLISAEMLMVLYYNKEILTVNSLHQCHF